MRPVVAAWERFWFEREMETSRLVALRVVFFGVLGLDQLYLMVEKGYRYGTGDFNVAHFDFLDVVLPIPSATVHTIIYLLCGFLALRIAAGVAVTSSLRLLAVIYGYAYFSSMNDGYQHHYLMVWLALISLAIPFHRISGVDHTDEPDEPGPTRVRSWGITLLYSQVAIVYLFTATTKATEHWFSGWAIEQQISRPFLRDWLASLESALSMGHHGIYAVIAHCVFFWQLLAAASFLVPKLRPIACITGPLFHIMVEVIGLEIRWFSYYMIALYYLMLFPESWYAPTARGIGRVLAPAGRAWAWMVKPRTLSADRRMAIVAIGSIVSALLLLTVPFASAWAVALAVAVLIILSEYTGDREAKASRTATRVGLQVAMALLMCAIPRYTDVGYNYYRWKGGDLSRRGEIREAVQAYQTANRLRPDAPSRHRKVASLLFQLGRYDEALESYRRARRYDPENPQVLRGMATTLRAMGRPQEATPLLQQMQQLQAGAAQLRRQRRNNGARAP